MSLKFLLNLSRALRLPFLAASVLPYALGALAAGRVDGVKFVLGMAAVAFTHCAANVLNDYADSKSGADAQDPRYFGFFGGTKLIQEKVFSEKFFLAAGIILIALSVLALAILALIMRSFSVLGYYCLILILTLAYSNQPFRLSYRMFGEALVFLLFGPVCVMGAYFIQSGIFPDGRIFLLSLPCGLLTTAILFANEVPDLPGDRRAGKFTWVSLTGGRRAFLYYWLICGLAFACIPLNLFLGNTGRVSVLALGFVPLVFKAGSVLRNDFERKEKLVLSSQLTIATQGLVSLVLIIDKII